MQAETLPSTLRTGLILDFAASLGTEVLVRGGELWRVDEEVRRIFDAYGLAEGAVFTLPHTLIVSGREPEREPLVRHHDVPEIHINMAELSRLHTLVDTVVETTPPPEQLQSMLTDAKRAETYPRYMTVVGMTIALVSLSCLISGWWADALFVGIGIVFVMGTQMLCSRYPWYNKMLMTVLTTFIVGTVDMLVGRTGLITSPYLVMGINSIGLVPGIPLINSFRELLWGRLLGGTLLFQAAFMETLMVAGGFTVAVICWGV